MITWVDVIYSPVVSVTGPVWWHTVGAPPAGLVSGLLSGMDLETSFSLRSGLPLSVLTSGTLPLPPILLCAVILCEFIPLLGLCWRGQQNPCTMTRTIKTFHQMKFIQIYFALKPAVVILTIIKLDDELKWQEIIGNDGKAHVTEKNDLKCDDNIKRK